MICDANVDLGYGDKMFDVHGRNAIMFCILNTSKGIMPPLAHIVCT